VAASSGPRETANSRAQIASGGVWGAQTRFRSKEHLQIMLRAPTDAAVKSGIPRPTADLGAWPPPVQTT
jgi:hypothetical protein